MSELIKHWMPSTGRNSALKSISAKPLRVTTRDAIIVTSMTLIATLAMMWIYYAATDTPLDTRDYGTIAYQTILTSMAAQYVYEYTGVNNMLAESSMRYAKGSTLAKYVSRREATVYQCYYELLTSKDGTSATPGVPTLALKWDITKVKKHFPLLITVLTHPMLTAEFADGKPAAYLHRKYPKDGARIDALFANIPFQSRGALPTISDHINENIIYDILVNGFSDYHLAPNPVISTVLDWDKLEARGESIANQIKKTRGD